MGTGTYAGAFLNSTAGSNWADRATFSTSVRIDRYVYFTNFDPVAFGTMHVKVWSDSAGLPNAPVAGASQDVGIASSSNLGTFGGISIWQVNLDLTPVYLSPGTYWFGASGNGFNASQAMLSPGPFDSNSALFTAGAFTTYSSFGDQAFQLTGAPVPEPFTLSLAGVALVAALRRRMHA